VVVWKPPAAISFGVVLIVMAQPFQTVAVCWSIQALTSPTLQAVTRSDSRCGFGKVPAFTLRHRVGALKGRGAGVSGRLGLCTSCDSRMNALSDKESNTEALMYLMLCSRCAQHKAVANGYVLCG
jgi:hypothetical protein